MTASALPVKTRNATAAFIAKLGAGYVAQIDAQKRPLMDAGATTGRATGSS